MTGRHHIVDALEAIVQEEVGRNVTALFAAARGGLRNAARAIVEAPELRVGLITGFYIPKATPPAAETDGPIGTALLIRGLVRAGVPCRLATDEPCANACRVALLAAGVRDVPLDVVALNEPLDLTVSRWRTDDVTHAVAIERCGRSSDGRPRNIRGLDIGPHTAALDDLFTGGPWTGIAVGDGGNEIGMGSLPHALIAEHVAHGESLACLTPADHLIVAGVSNWGAYALIGAMALLRDDWRSPMLSCLDLGLHRTVLGAMVEDGPAVDGVSLLQQATVDSLSLARHEEKLLAIRRIIEQAG